MCGTSYYFCIANPQKRRRRKIMTKYRNLHQNSLLHRLYISRQEGGRWKGPDTCRRHTTLCTKYQNIIISQFVLGNVLGFHHSISGWRALILSYTKGTTGSPFAQSTPQWSIQQDTMLLNDIQDLLSSALLIGNKPEKGSILQ